MEAFLTSYSCAAVTGAALTDLAFEVLQAVDVTLMLPLPHATLLNCTK